MKVVIADDHKLMRSGFKSLLTAFRHDVVAEAEDTPDLLALMSVLDVELLVTDYDMPGGELIPALESIRNDHPNLKIIILTSFQYPVVYQQILSSEAKVQGLLLKSVEPKVMHKAINEISQGKHFIQDEIAQLINNSSNDSPLDKQPHLKSPINA
jgi:DNA-binding NarL/FixJ family response regulator